MKADEIGKEGASRATMALIPCKTISDVKDEAERRLGIQLILMERNAPLFIHLDSFYFSGN